MGLHCLNHSFNYKKSEPSIRAHKSINTITNRGRCLIPWIPDLRSRPHQSRNIRKPYSSAHTGRKNAGLAFLKRVCPFADKPYPAGLPDSHSRPRLLLSYCSNILSWGGALPGDVRACWSVASVISALHTLQATDDYWNYPVACCCIKGVIKGATENVAAVSTC